MVLFSILVAQTIVDISPGGVYVLIECPILLYFIYVSNYSITWYGKEGERREGRREGRGKREEGERREEGRRREEGGKQEERRETEGEEERGEDLLSLSPFLNCLKPSTLFFFSLEFFF
jgi:hypothetical protein